MREIRPTQINFGEVDISQIKFNPRSRDEMPQVLRGLQYIYITPSIRQPVFALLEKHILPEVSKKNGRPGMDLWQILVLGVVRLNLNWDYDRLEDEVNNHCKLREMLGHGDTFMPVRHEYSLQTLKDNVSLLTEELINEINVLVVKAGHALLKKKDPEMLEGRCDSFVLESNVHFPTDITLLFDALRKVMTLSARACMKQGSSSLRQHVYQLRCLKNLLRVIQTRKHSRPKTPAAIEKKNAGVVKAHVAYLGLATTLLLKTVNALSELKIEEDEIEQYIVHAKRQMDQIERRVIKGEVIPHEEKVFSLFEPHTEWISKGKAGVPVELGLRVCILECASGFILNHVVMQKQTDDQVAVEITRETKKRFPGLRQVSYDKGFHSPENQKDLAEILQSVVLPKKGKCSKARAEEESSPAFKRARCQHSAVESAINALEVHGLDYCPDKGLDAFKCYVSLAVLSRNLQKTGAILQQKTGLKDKRLKQRALNEALRLKAA